MSLRETIARNTFFNALGRVWEAILSLILVAYIVSQVGTVGYGLWAVVGAFTGYAALFDLGIGSAYAKYIAEHAARDEHDSISSVVTTGFSFYLLFGIFFVAVGWYFLDIFVGVVQGMNPERTGDFSSEPVLKELSFLIRWGLVLFAISNCLAPFTAVQTGLQRMGVTNAISAMMSLVKVAATVLFLELGHGVRGLLYANGVVMLVFAVATICAAFILHPTLRLSASRVDFVTFMRLFRFGWRSQVSRLSNLVMFETDVLVIAILLRDMELAGLYRIGVELANKMRQIPAILLSALLPAASELDARDEHERLTRLYLVSTKYVAVIAVPMALFIAGSAGLLIRTWQGTEMDLAMAAMVLRIMAIGYVANMMPGAGVSVVLGMGRPEIQMRAGLISMSSNILLTVALAYTIGFWGIPLATGLSMVLSWAWFAHAIDGVVGVSPKELAARAMKWPLLAAIPGLALCALVDYFSLSTTGRLDNAMILCGVALFFAVSYLLFIRKTSLFDEHDVHFFDETLGLGRIPGYKLWSQSLRVEQRA